MVGLPWGVRTYALASLQLCAGWGRPPRLTHGNDDEHGHPDGDALNPLALMALLLQREAQHRGDLRRAGASKWAARARANVHAMAAAAAARRACGPYCVRAGHARGLHAGARGAQLHGVGAAGGHMHTAPASRRIRRTSAAAMRIRMIGSWMFSQHSAKKFLAGTALYLLGPNTRACSATLPGAPAGAAASRPAVSWLAIARASPATPPSAFRPSRSLICAVGGGGAGLRARPQAGRALQVRDDRPPRRQAHLVEREQGGRLDVIGAGGSVVVRRSLLAGLGAQPHRPDLRPRPPARRVQLRPGPSAGLGMRQGRWV